LRISREGSDGRGRLHGKDSLDLLVVGDELGGERAAVVRGVVRGFVERVVGVVGVILTLAMSR